ncbi:MAG TPA: hypothetical protein VFU71_19080, partial [Burkholderiaceae bacterium]|nr:hypothetical protein [Burkholderiaceae bacterium]
PFATRSTRRLAWLLALALLLPFAQSLAWAHQLTHHSAQRADAGALGQLDTSCAICLGAAPLHGGALPAAQPIVVAPSLAHAAPTALADAWQRHAETHAYLSRAPPHNLT